MAILQNIPGTYILFLKLSSRSELQIGRNKTRQTIFQPGYYGYVGSALGPGGLSSRLRRHASTSLRKHWHIDYFVDHAELLGAFVIDSGDRLECQLAASISRLAKSCCEGFGASDCTCKGHLFFIDASLNASLFMKEVEEKLAAQYFSRKEIV